MKIFIDVSELIQFAFMSGIQRAVTKIAIQMIDSGKQDIVLLCYNAAKDSYYRIENQAFVDFYAFHKGQKKKMITNEKVPLADIGKGTVFFELDAAWTCRVRRSYLLPVLKQQGTEIVSHIYDIIPITHPQYFFDFAVYHFMDYIGAHLQYADRIIVNAQATREELEKLAKRLGLDLPPCHVVPLGADFTKQETIYDSQVPEYVRMAVNERPYILMVGTIEPRKNHKLLLDAYDKGLKEMGYNIVLAGYIGWNMEEFVVRLQSHLDYGKRIFHFLNLDDKAIGYLYQHARFLAFCSYTEGFGLPIIESVLRGTPVIVSDVPVLREAAEEYCIWFEQDNAEELCARVREYTEDEELYRRCCSKLKAYNGHSWEEIGRKMESIVST